MDRHSFNPRFVLFVVLFFAISFCAIGTSAAPSSNDYAHSESASISSRSTHKLTNSPSTTSSLPEKESPSPSTSETASPTTDTSGGVASDYVVPTPRAFDTSVAFNNFSSTGCMPFFQNFLNNDTFINCLPLSFFLQNSKSWFDITKQGLIPVTKALDASCSVDSGMCSALMNTFSIQLLQAENCGSDFKERNPIVMQAYASFLTYPVVFAAGCQRSSTGYCYADAITNATNVADTYVYLMPLGIPIPGGARLTCSSCLQRTMRIFAAAASNESQPLSSTYIPGAQLINVGCGPGFANTSIADITNSAPSGRPSTWIPTITIIALVSMILL